MKTGIGLGALALALAACSSSANPEPVEQIIVREIGAEAVPSAAADPPTLAKIW
jgi:hypothetical protein